MIRNTSLTVREFVALVHSHLSGQGGEASDRLGPLEEHLPPAAVDEVLFSWFSHFGVFLHIFCILVCHLHSRVFQREF